MPRAHSSRSQSAEEGWIELGDDLVFHRVPVDSEDLIVAFSARPIELGRFHFFSLTDLFPSASKLLVRDPSRSWYNAGLPGIGETVGEIAVWLREQVDLLSAKRVIMTGPSMGGYAAILFGCMLGAERVVAISPQTLLDPALRWMVPPAELALQVPDLEPVIRDAPETRIDVVFGWGSMLDTFHAQRVAAAPSVRLFSARGGHDLARELNERERLWPLLGELIDGRVPSDCGVDPQLDPELLPTLREAIVATAREDWTAAAVAATLLAERCPDWPTARVARAELLSRAAKPVAEI
jgi:acetyl esterase/lipase